MAYTKVELDKFRDELVKHEPGLARHQVRHNVAPFWNPPLYTLQKDKLEEMWAEIQRERQNGPRL